MTNSLLYRFSQRLLDESCRSPRNSPDALGCLLPSDGSKFLLLCHTNTAKWWVLWLVCACFEVYKYKPKIRRTPNLLLGNCFFAMVFWPLTFQTLKKQTASKALGTPPGWLSAISSPGLSVQMKPNFPTTLGHEIQKGWGWQHLSGTVATWRSIWRNVYEQQITCDCLRCLSQQKASRIFFGRRFL